MRGAAVFAALVALGLLLLPGGGSGHAEPFAPGQNFNQALAAQVTGTALAFMAPRTLDAIPVPQMALWGLRGLATLDPRFAPDISDGALRLSLNARLLMARPLPADADAAGWGVAVAQLARIAWDSSDVIRRAGNEGFTRSFFDELFNHFDPYSRYVPPDEAASDRQRRDGRGGIAAAVSATGLVESVQAGGPAAASGVRAGERILAIDGAALETATPATPPAALLDGPEGSIVRLTVRGRDRRVRTIDITRVPVPGETVSAARMGDALLLRVTGFTANTGERLAGELTRALSASRPPRGIVLDLRGNRGGLLRQAVAAAEAFLARGTVAVTVGRDPEAAHEFTAGGTDLAQGRPVVVVVDGRSASSAEILAAALADAGRAVVVGSATLGKGLVQTVVTLPDGGDLYVTWSRVLAPLGWPLQSLGVLPQVCTSLGETELAASLAALEAGHQPMARALQRHRDARAPLAPAEAIDIRSACPAAGGRDGDLDAARYLFAHQAAYDTALIHPATQ